VDVPTAKMPETPNDNEKEGKLNLLQNLRS
jgi:hypothetical protein